MVRAAINQMLRKRRYLSAFIALTVLLFFAYAYLFSYFAFGILFFGKLYPAFVVLISIIISVLLSLVLTLNAYSLSNYQRSYKQVGLPSMSVILSASLSLCCGTVIPSLLAVFGASTPFILSNGGKIEGFFSTFEIPLIAISIILLLFSLYMVSKSICDVCKIKSELK